MAFQKMDQQIDRRTFTKRVISTTGAIMLGLQGCAVFSSSAVVETGPPIKDSRKIFFSKGCSTALFHIVNREFGHSREDLEPSTEFFMGGVLQKGHQCGMLWGASLAVGAESYRRYGNSGRARQAALSTTQHLNESFIEKSGSANCGEITNTDASTVLGLIKYFITGKFISCSGLGKAWTPDAVRVSRDGVAVEFETDDLPMSNCACEVARKSGASEEDAAMVAGFAGGLGLGGNACGALAAAIWARHLPWSKKQTSEKPEVTDLLKAFYRNTDSKIRCRDICGQLFDTPLDHAKYVENGGCEKLIQALAVAAG